MDNMDLLNDDDQDYQDFMQRKNTIVENINKFSSAKFPQNHQKQKEYMSKVQEVFKIEQDNFLKIRDQAKPKGKL